MKPFLLLLLLLQTALATTAVGADYLLDVKPLLQQKCYACHGVLKQQGGLRVDTAVALIQGGDSGSTVSAGKPNDSLLIEVLTGAAGFQMPPANEGAPLTAEETDLIRQWVLEGASTPAEEAPQLDPNSWWSYQPNQRPSLPVVSDPKWCREEVDYFVAAARESRGLGTAVEATKSVWLRRVFIDLIGLPPTPEELHDFLDDGSPNAFEAVVDDLLARPQYGERWGRHWMDVWRYSDWYGSRAGNEIRYSQRHIWRWRDWIVASLNADKGYDRMIQEMLSADEISGGDMNVLPATGYLGRNWYKFDRDVWLFETVERAGEAFLGVTFRCCRCHDHKFDPITQEDYYRFRAFFEAHDVRTDPISASSKTQKDPTLGVVPSDGIAVVYDKTPDAVTYRFERGDSRYPATAEPLSPGVPASLGGAVEITPVELPTFAWYPMLRPKVRQTLLEKCEADIARAATNLTQAEASLNDAMNKMAVAELAKNRSPESLRSGSSTSESSMPDVRPQSDVLIDDDFAAARPNEWETVSGTWTYVDGKLLQSEVTSFATLATEIPLPTDIHVHLRYRPLSPGTYRSVGFSFDYQDPGNSQDVYTSTGDSRQSVQAFHRIGGKQDYPAAGIVSTSLNVAEEAVLDVAISGSSLTIELNGEEKLEYALPLKRREGRFALWVHDGAAEFLELRVTKLAPSADALLRQQLDAEQAVAVARAELELARGEAESTQRRLAADIAKYIDSDLASAETLAHEALRAEQAVGVLRARAELTKLGDSQETRAEKEKTLAAAEETATTSAGTYSPVGEQFPKTSTGRRKALAKWITSAENPRTARVAVNHIWARHFGQPLVTTPENFGLSGRQPTHPQLLDWLASELIANNWQMKPLHRQLVLSASYRMSSQPLLIETNPAAGTNRLTEGDHSTIGNLIREADHEQREDPENRYLWRMNSHRMEAEVVRDATLYLSGRLDLTIGGPEIAETLGESTLRRSFYFRNTPNEKMEMLEAFDVADPNACYRRKESIVPHQSLALMNSGLTQDAARTLAGQLADHTNFVNAAFEAVLGRQPTSAEESRCAQFLREHQRVLEERTQPFSEGGSATRTPSDDNAIRARENLIHVLFLHNDFVTIR